MKQTYPILEKTALTDVIGRISVRAPLIAAKAKPGQFVILRVDEDGERIPLTISSCTADAVTVIYQKVGATTLKLDEKKVGDCLADFVGPLGRPTEVTGYKRAVVVGGGLGTAIALPIAKALKDNGCKVDLIAGFRTKDIIILEDQMRDSCENLFICTDDGSYGYSGFVTGKLEDLLKEGNEYDVAFAIGPLMMMKFACKTTEKYNLPTIVSMNPIMVDGTGMCGGCRVTVGGQTKFACVDGPDFDGHQVDFDETIARTGAYKAFEKEQKERHQCRMEGMQNG